MTIQKIGLASLFFISALLAPLTLQALPDDSSKPINIEADSFDYNQNEGRGEYRGNVIATQGSMRITAEVLTVIMNDAGSFEKIEATGSPVNFSMKPRADRPEMVGVGKQLTYFVDRSEIEVKNDASITQGADKITGNLIQYNVDTTELKARNLDEGRVSVRMTPGN